MDKDIVCCGANENLTNEDSISNSSSIFLIMISKLLLLFLVLSIDYTRHLRPRWQGFNFFSNHFHSVSIYLHLNYSLESKRIKLLFLLPALKISSTSLWLQSKHRWKTSISTTMTAHSMCCRPILYHQKFNCQSTPFELPHSIHVVQSNNVLLSTPKRVHFHRPFTFWMAWTMCCLHREAKKRRIEYHFWQTGWQKPHADARTHSRQTGQTRFHLGNI